MKSLNTPSFRHLLLTAVTVLTLAAAGTAFADDDHHDAWSHDKTGYWDDHNTHHEYVLHNNHHGYWRTKHDGTKFFINID
jgi:hypothetical protein